MIIKVEICEVIKTNGFLSNLWGSHKYPFLLLWAALPWLFWSSIGCCLLLSLSRCLWTMYLPTISLACFTSLPLRASNLLSLTVIHCLYLLKGLRPFKSNLVSWLKSSEDPLLLILFKPFQTTWDASALEGHRYIVMKVNLSRYHRWYLCFLTYQPNIIGLTIIASIWMHISTQGCIRSNIPYELHMVGFTLATCLIF